MSQIEIGGKTYQLRDYDILSAEQATMIAQKMMEYREEWAKDPMDEAKRQKYADAWLAYCKLQIRESDIEGLALNKINPDEYRRLSLFFFDGMKTQRVILPDGNETSSDS